MEGSEEGVHRGASSLQPLERAQRHQVLKSMHRRSTASNSTCTCKSCSVRCARVACLLGTRRGHRSHAMPGKASTRATLTARRRPPRQREASGRTPGRPSVPSRHLQQIHAGVAARQRGRRRTVARQGAAPRSPNGYPSGSPHGPKGPVRNLHNATHSHTPGSRPKRPPNPRTRTACHQSCPEGQPGACGAAGAV